MLVHDTVAPERPAAACLVLHGLGDSRLGWRPVVDMIGIPEMAWIFAQAPRAYHGGWSWFDILPDFSIAEDQVREAREQIRGLIAECLRTLALPPERLFLLGFSQGCLMALDVGLRDARRFAGLIGISGWLGLEREYPEALGPAARSQRVFWSHGTGDGLIPIVGVRRQKDAVEAMGVPVEWRVYDKDHGLDPAQELPAIAAFIRGGLAG